MTMDRNELVRRVERSGLFARESKRRLAEAEKSGDAKKIQRMKQSVAWAASDLAREAHALAMFDMEMRVPAFA